MDPEGGTGTLYVVATPIGNVADVSPRALEVLGSVDRVLAEDTRRTGRLLARLGVRAKLESHHEHNERSRIPRVIEDLVAGARLALVSDAGTPLVSDPGYRLVRAAAEAAVAITPIPGPSAVLAALSVSGLPTDRFFFAGYLPPRAGKRRTAIAGLRDLAATLIFFETPQRIASTLRDLHSELGDRAAAACRELTKVHEEVRRGPLSALALHHASVKVRGEITLVVEGASRRRRVDP